MPKKLPAKYYHYRGQIERGSPSTGYRWVAGYSAVGENGQPLYPWMTAIECRHEASGEGKRAVFL